MSFSLEVTDQDEDEVEQAIKQATHQKVLVFAAAANYRHNKRTQVGFPANMREHVFCINSHRGNCDKGSHFTPLPQENCANFAVIGEGIEGAWQGNTITRKKGTSCSTPIAAGIAAIVLDYARLRRNHTSMKDVWKVSRLPGEIDKAGNANGKINNTTNLKELRDRNRLQDTQAMKQILFHRMTPGGRSYGGNDYSFVKPWFLFDPNKSEDKVATQVSTLIQERQQWTVIS